MEMKDRQPKTKQVVYVQLRQATRVGNRLQVRATKCLTIHNAVISEVEAALNRGIRKEKA